MNVPNAAGVPCAVSIVIKALNEEKRIEAAVQSALKALEALRPLQGEVVLADSCSTDRTVELASRYPIRIVQLANPGERCCGIGPQLGYQHSLGEFVYILDGDMQMLDGFLPQALAFMRAHPDVAGVAGRVVEVNTQSMEYLARMERASGHMQPGDVDRLDMGGLYRRQAIEQAGYFSDRNLHSYEEFDLAVRLRVRGWKLWRIDVDSVLHHGHDAPALQLLQRRWRSRYICGLGELVRGAAGEPHWRLVLAGVRELRLYVAVLAWWLVLLGALLWPASAGARACAFAVLLLAPVALMTWRKKSLRKALFSVVSWCFNAAGLVRGLLVVRRPPQEAVQSTLVRDTSVQA